MSKQDYRALGKPEELCRKQSWISVKDKLPEDDGPVIAVYHFNGNTVRYISTLSYFCFDPQPQKVWGLWSRTGCRCLSYQRRHKQWFYIKETPRSI